MDPDDVARRLESLEAKIEQLLRLVSPVAQAWAELQPQLRSLLTKARFMGLRRG